VDRSTVSGIDLPDVPELALLLDNATMDERVTESFCKLESIECLSVCHLDLEGLLVITS
jgi:hypothetical protein